MELKCCRAGVSPLRITVSKMMKIIRTILTEHPLKLISQWLSNFTTRLFLHSKGKRYFDIFSNFYHSFFIFSFLFFKYYFLIFILILFYGSFFYSFKCPDYFQKIRYFFSPFHIRNLDLIYYIFWTISVSQMKNHFVSPSKQSE